MRSILHDWPDDKCIEILKHLRAAAQPTTRLLILDMLLSYATSSTTSDNSKGSIKAPAPLLANAGHASVFQYQMDMMVRTYLVLKKALS